MEHGPMARRWFTQHFKWWFSSSLWQLCLSLPEGTGLAWLGNLSTCYCWDDRPAVFFGLWNCSCCKRPKKHPVAICSHRAIGLWSIFPGISGLYRPESSVRTSAITVRHFKNISPGLINSCDPEVGGGLHQIGNLSSCLTFEVLIQWSKTSQL